MTLPAMDFVLTRMIPATSRFEITRPAPSAL